MDGLSTVASVISVLQAASFIVSVCYDFRASLKHQPWALTRCLDEVTELRTVLERLERLTRHRDSRGRATDNDQRRLDLLCDSQIGSPLALCLRELAHLQNLLGVSHSSDAVPSKR